MIRIFKLKNKNRHQKIIKILGLLLVVMVAIFFRAYNLENTIYWWNGDTSRDILMARHIAFLGDRPTTGPNIAGGYEYLNNSPLIYYVFGLVYRIWDNILTIPYFLIIIDSLAIGFGYWLLFEFGGLLSLFFGLTLAVNSYLSWITRFVMCPLYLQSVTLLIIFFWNMSNKSKNLRYFLGYIFLCTLSLHVHYAELALFPVLGIGGLWLYFRNKTYKKKWFLPIVWLVGCLLLWIKLTYREKMFDQVQVLGLFQKNHFTIYQLLVNSWEIHKIMLKNLFGVKNIVVEVIFWGLIYFGGGLVTWFLRKKYSLLFLLYCLFISINLISFIGGYQTDGVFYTYPFYVILLMLVFILLQLIQKRKFGYNVGLIVGVLLFVQSFGYKSGQDLVNKWNYNNKNIDTAIYLSDLIVSDSKKSGISNYDLVYYDKYTNLEHFGTSNLWYFLEKVTDKKLVKVVDDGGKEAAYFVPINNINLMVYFICSNVVYEGKWDQFENCEDLYIDIKKEQGLFFKKETILENREGDVRYRLLKLKVISQSN